MKNVSTPQNRSFPLALIVGTLACLLLVLPSRAANIVQGTGANFIAWEAENNVTTERQIDPAAPNAGITWTSVTDSTASGGGGLSSTGAADSNVPRAKARYTLVFNAAGTYQLYLRYRCNNSLGGQNSYRFPVAFGQNPADRVTQANQQGNPTTFTYVVGGDREQNTANQATYVVAPADVGVPQVFTIGTRESGFEIDRFILSTDLGLTEAAFNATPNSPTFSFSRQPQDMTAVVGGSATFSATVDQGTLPYTYQWYTNGVIDPSGTSASYTVAGLTASDSLRTFYVVATDATPTSITSRTARLGVVDLNGAISVSYEGRGDCSPGCSTLIATDVAGTVPLGNWNNFDNSADANFSGTTPPLNDANATATAITLNFAANDSWNNDQTPVDSANRKMMKGISKANGGDRENTYTFQGLSDGYYDLIVYLNVNGDGRIGDISAGGTTFYYTSQHRFDDANANPDVFTRCINSSSTGARDQGNYVQFTRIYANSSHNLPVSFINRGDPDGIGIAGFQLFGPTGTEPIAFTQQPVSTTVGGGTPFSFTAAVSGSGPLQVQWRTNGIPIPGANSLTYSGTASLAMNGIHFSVSVSNSIPSGAISSDAILTVASVPVLISASTLDSVNRIYLRFTKPIDATTAANTGNYIVNNGVIVNSAALAASDPSIVILQTTPMTPGVTYTVQISNLTDTDGTPHFIFPNPTTTTVSPGGYDFVRLTYKRYEGITGGNVSDLTGNAKYPNSPDFVQYNGNNATGARATSPRLMEYPQTGNFGGVNIESFGAQIYGLYIAPASGNYQFAIATDDHSELWLSTDANPANRYLIASMPDWTGERQYIERDRGGANAHIWSNAGRPSGYDTVSSNITLVAGNSYYLQGIYKEGGGGDHIEIAVRPPAAVAIDNGLAGIALNQFGPDPSGLRYYMAGDQAYTPGPVTLSNPAQPADQHVVEGQSVSFTIAFTGTPPITVEWYDNGTNLIAGANGPTLTFTALSANDGHTFTAKIKNACSTATSRAALLQVDVDTTKPTASAGCEAADAQIRVLFSEPVISGGGADAGDNPGNYAIDGGLSITAAALLSDNRTVILTANGNLTPDAPYVLTVQSVKDRSVGGNTMDPTNITIRGCVCTNTVVLFEMYRGNSGPNNFQSMTNNPKFPNNPDLIALLPGPGPNWAQTPNAYFTAGNEEQYSGRMRGHIVPTASGNYTFGVHADDSGMFRISTDSGPAGLRTILFAQGDCGACGTPNSSAVSLVAGRAYYFEALFQEGGGGDYMDLLWTPPGSGRVAIPAANLRFCVDPLLVPFDITGPTDVTIQECGNATFSVTVNAPGQGPITYQWFDGDTAIPGETNRTLRLINVPLARDGSTFHVTVNTALRSKDSVTAMLTVTEDMAAPTLVAVTSDHTLTHVTVSFSEPMDVASATDTSFYQVGDGVHDNLAISGAIVVDETNVVLTTDRQLEGSNYVVAIIGGPLYDRCGPPTAGNHENNFVAVGSSLTFRAWVFVPCLARFQTYDVGGGNSIPLLTGSPLYPNSPRETRFIAGLDSRIAYPDDSHEAYGGRIWGYIVPPVTGDFTFAFANDDDFAVRMNTNSVASDDPAGAVQIAANVCCNGGLANAVTVHLEAGLRYYIEGLWKEGVGGDYLRIGAALSPGTPQILGPDYIGTYINPDILSSIIPTLPTSGKRPLGTPGTRGFDVRIVQVSTNIANTLVIAESMLAGTAGPNIAGVPRFHEPDIINYSVEVSNYGSIPSDKKFPGIPNGSPFPNDNIAMEAVTYVELHKGFHCWIVNSDDGFRLTPALCATDPNNSMVLGFFDGGRGATDSPFVFNVPEDGLYPMRLIWEQGGGGGNVEWVDIQPSNPNFLSPTPYRYAVNGNNNIKAFSPTALSISVVGTTATVSWVGGTGAPCHTWKLQSTTQLENNPANTIWTDSPSIVTIGPNQLFFRLIDAP